MIINDGSTDNTLKICKSIKDKRIRIITTENKGLSLSRNIGLDNAKGEYLYFIDADDFIEKDTIEYLYNLIEKYNRLIAICESKAIYSYDFNIEKTSEKIEIKKDKELIKKLLFFIGDYGTTWNKLYKKEIFNNIRFEDRIVNDVVTTYKLYIESKEIIYSNQIKYYYYKHSDSIIARREGKRSIDMYKGALERYYYIKNIYPDFIENDVGMLLMIFKIYYKDYKKIKEFYKESKIKKVYNKIFTLKLLKTDLRFNDKIKLLTFRISPRLSRLITDIYIKINHL